MAGLAEPWWLFALALVPLLWWLHRWRAPLGRVDVSAIFLWRKAAETGDRGAVKQRPDPAWLQRALIAALIIAALAQPWWIAGRSHLTIWIDDGLSMHVDENGATRLTAGFAELQALAASHGADQVILRSTHDPFRQSPFTQEAMADTEFWQAMPRGPATWVPPLLSRDSAHWLLTDGASATIRRWASQAPFDRVIRVGVETENSAVTRLAARRNSQSPGTLDVLIDVVNPGLATAHRELGVFAAGAPVHSSSLELGAGERQQITLSLPAASGMLVARLDPHDALAIDDELQLDLGSMAPVGASVDPRCPAALQVALAAHAGLQLTDPGHSMLDVRCSGTLPGNKPTLLFHTGASASLASAPAWLPEAGELQSLYLQTEWILTHQWSQPVAAGDTILLRAGELPLIVQRANAPLIESVIDVSHSLLTDQAGFPVLLAGMIDVALDRNLLDPVLVAAREPANSNIIPHDVPVSGSAGVTSRSVRNDFEKWLLALALLLLVLDTVFVARASWNARHA